MTNRLHNINSQSIDRLNGFSMTICAMSPGKLGFAMHFCEHNKIQIPGKISLLIRKFNWIFLWMFLYPKMRGKISWKNYTIAYSILINFYISRYCMEGIWPNIFFSKLDAIIIFRAHRSFVLYMACLLFFCSTRMGLFHIFWDQSIWDFWFQSPKGASRNHVAS